MSLAPLQRVDKETPAKRAWIQAGHSQEKSAFLSPMPSFINHLLANESDCTKHSNGT